jgi:hypothetical protein
MSTLDNVEKAITTLRSSTRRQQARAAMQSLKGSPALSHPSVADSPSAAIAWDRAIDLILEEKV